MLTYTMGSLIIPLLTLTYILQIPSILFTGFSSFKFKDWNGVFFSPRVKGRSETCVSLPPTWAWKVTLRMATCCDEGNRRSVERSIDMDQPEKSRTNVRRAQEAKHPRFSGACSQRSSSRTSFVKEPPSFRTNSPLGEWKS